jgi:hypothetical protein
MKSFALTLVVESVDVSDRSVVSSLRETGLSDVRLVRSGGEQKLKVKELGESRGEAEDKAISKVCGCLPGVIVRVASRR